MNKETVTSHLVYFVLMKGYKMVYLGLKINIVTASKIVVKNTLI